MLVEGIITIILVGSLFYVAPSILSTVSSSAPTVNSTLNPALAASRTSINAIAAGGLNLAAISVIMLGIGLMIAGFMLVRTKQ